MSAAIALSVDCGTDTIHFFQDEVLDAVVQPLGHCQVLNHFSCLPGIEYSGEVWNTLQIRICENRTDTLQRLQQVMDYTDLVYVRYAFTEDPELQMQGLIYPGYKKTIVFGNHRAAKINHVLTILECA